MVVSQIQHVHVLLPPPHQSVLDALDVPESFPEGNPQRAIYCSRTLNLRSIKAIGESEGSARVRILIRLT